MFVGHAAVAFALVGLGARALGVPRARALHVAAFAAVVAVLPDVDMVYALVGLASAATLDPIAVAESFWAASTVAHRSVTHSLLFALLAAAAIGLVAAGGRDRLVGLAALSLALVAVGLVTAPAVWIGAVAFFGGAAALGVLAARTEIDPLTATAAATVALVAHPFGDLFTGSPPWLVYPVDAHLVTDRVALAPDPTLHLLGAFFLELAAIWLGVYALYHLHDERLRSHLRPRAALGGAYVLAALVLPAPTLEVSYHFVFSVTAVGFLGMLPERLPVVHGSRPAVGHRTRLVTGLAAITVAALAYAAGYLLL